MFEGYTEEGYIISKNETSIKPTKLKVEHQTFHYQVQSVEHNDVDNVMEGDNETQQEIVGFDDAHPGVDHDIRYDLSYLRGDGSTGADIANFLKRPVNIYSKEWTIGGTLDYATPPFKPWYLFFNHPAIKRKLDNYYMLKCNLKIKLVINASPFYYGGGILTYQPLPIFNPNILVTGNLNELIPLSQRPHIYFYPQNNQGGTLTLPFFYHKEWLNATSAEDLQNMGDLSLVSLDELRNANSVVGTNCTIQIYAWAEDLELAGPTLRLAVQSTEVPIDCPEDLGDYVVQSKESKKGDKDEYHHEGTISKPASALARLAGLLKNTPVIGPFMTATSMLAGGVAGMASLFGYTNVPVIDDVHEFKNQPFPQFAATEIGIPIEKATIDSKNELSIDPKITYHDAGDELAIANIVTRESYIGSFDWVASDVEGTLLYNFGVNPSICQTLPGVNETILFQTPMGYLSRCFKYWRGDIKFRFKFLASQYHRGRVRITWDPYGDLSGTADTTTTNFTRIVDISESSDVTIVVPYTQPTAYLPVTTSTTDTHNSAVSIFPFQVFNNGILTMRVLTEQTSPVASAPITVATFISGCDNLEFAGPTEINSLFSPYYVQSSEIAYDGEDNDEYQLGVTGSNPYPGINLVYMGETITSMRQLLRRTTRCGFYPFEYTYNAANTKAILRSFIRRIPLLPGFDLDGCGTAIGINSGTSKPYNWTHWTYTAYMSLCYIGHRGSYNWHLDAISTPGCQLLTLERGIDTLSTANYSLGSATSGATSAQERIYATSAKSGQTGLTLTNQDTQAAICLSVPMYSRYKFHSNNSATRTIGDDVDDTRQDSVVATAVFTPANVDNFSDGAFSYFGSAGADFTFVFFLNAPVMHSYIRPSPT